jgi:hypothetical protein
VLTYYFLPINITHFPHTIPFKQKKHILCIRFEGRKIEGKKKIQKLINEFRLKLVQIYLLIFVFFSLKSKTL